MGRVDSGCKSSSLAPAGRRIVATGAARGVYFVSVIAQVTSPKQGRPAAANTIAFRRPLRG